MKYIRTKENTIVEISDKSQFYTYDNEKIVLEKGKRGYEMVRGFVDRVADTIEELCDRYVVIHKYGEQPKDMSFYEAEYFIDVWTRKVKSNDPISAIYGAIWTDKGLIYVAKMNDKGELELL